MGGIAGYLNNGNLNPDENTVKLMRDKIAHRTAAGPVYNAAGNLEMYFDGSSLLDAREVLRGYEEYGEEVLHTLRGAFAFVIYNSETRELFGARDHFGIKPFYYHKTGVQFIFGSEIKSFLAHPGFKKELNGAALKMFLVFQYPVLEETFFKGVFKLPQGCFFRYKNEELTIKRYFDIAYKTRELPFGEYMDIIDKTLRESIDYYKAGDTEIASFLSGGVDSSFIAALSKPIKTFSVGFGKDGFDESVYAAELSDMLGIENHKKIISGDEFFEVLPTVQYCCDEPYANLSGVPLYFLAQMAVADVKVCLSGEGADEFFSGYLPFAESRFTRAYSKLPFGCRRFIHNMIKPLPNFKGKATIAKYGQKVEDYYIGQAFIMDDSEANDILSGKYKSDMGYRDVTAPYFAQVKDESDLIKKSYLDLFLWLPNDILLKADKLTAIHGLEVRAPILDKEMFAVASKIPKKYLIKNQTTKWIFREAANRVLPKEWAARKKLGFPVPFTLWLREQKYRDILQAMFDEDFVSEFFERGKLLEMLNEHFKGAKNNGRKLYTIYSFLVWYKVYFGGEHG